MGKYLKKSNEIDVKRCLIISHDELVSNYKETLIKISRKFNLQLNNKPIIKPDGYFNRGGAKSQPMKNKIYNHE